LGDAFKALLVDTSEEIKEQYSDSYFTLVKVLLIKSSIPSIIIPYTKTLVNNLNN